MKNSHQIYSGVVKRLGEYRQQLGLSQSELNEIWSKFDASILQRFLQYLKFSSEILKYKKED